LSIGNIKLQLININTMDGEEVQNQDAEEVQNQDAEMPEDLTRDDHAEAQETALGVESVKRKHLHLQKDLQFTEDTLDDNLDSDEMQNKKQKIDMSNVTPLMEFIPAAPTDDDSEDSKIKGQLRLVCPITKCPTSGTDTRFLSKAELEAHVSSYHTLAFDIMQFICMSSCTPPKYVWYKETFTASVTIQLRTFEGNGPTEKFAKSRAAQLALEKLFNFHFTDVDKFPRHVGNPEIWKQYAVSKKHSNKMDEKYPDFVLRRVCHDFEYGFVSQSSDECEPLSCIMSVIVDGQTFHGCGRDQILAKARAAQTACETLYNLKFESHGDNIPTYAGDEAALKEQVNLSIKKNAVFELTQMYFNKDLKCDFVTLPFQGNTIQCTLEIEGQVFVSTALNRKKAKLHAFTAALQYLKNTGLYDTMKEEANERRKQRELKRDEYKAEKSGIPLEEFLKLKALQDGDKSKESYEEKLEVEYDDQNYEGDQGKSRGLFPKPKFNPISKKDDTGTAKVVNIYTCPVQKCARFLTKEELNNHIANYHVSSDVILNYIHPDIAYNDMTTHAYAPHYEINANMSVTVDGKTYQSSANNKPLAKARAAQLALQDVYNLAFTYNLGELMPRHLGGPEKWKQHVKDVNSISCPIIYCNEQFGEDVQLKIHLNSSHTSPTQIINYIYAKSNHNHVKSAGTQHAPEFVMSVEVENQTFEGRAKSKNLAKTRASQAALEKLYSFKFIEVDNLILYSGAEYDWKQYGFSRKGRNKLNVSSVAILREITQDLAVYSCTERSSSETDPPECTMEVKFNEHVFKASGRNEAIAKARAAQIALETVHALQFSPPTGEDVPLYQGDEETLRNILQSNTRNSPVSDLLMLYGKAVEFICCVKRDGRGGDQCCCELMLEDQLFESASSCKKTAKQQTATLAITYLKETGLYEVKLAERNQRLKDNQERRQEEMRKMKEEENAVKCE